MTITGWYRIKITCVVVILGALLLRSAQKQLFYLHADTENGRRRIYILYYSNITGSGIRQSIQD